MVLFLMVRENSRWTSSLAAGAGARIAGELGAYPDQAGLEAACRGLVPSDALAGAAYLDPSGNPLYAFPELPTEGFRRDDWVIIPARGSGSVGILPGRSGVASLAGPVLGALAVICLALAVTAMLMPAYLRSRVIDPLRSILLQADRYRSGSGTNPGAASVSFREMVDLLSDKERELESLRVQAVARADLAESRAGAVLEMLDSAVAALDSDGSLAIWNARATELFRLEESDRGMPFPAGRTPLGTGTGTGEREVEFLGRAYRVKSLNHSGGETIVTATDISDILALERRLAEERALADLGAFSGGVVHEIGNTLCALRGFLDLLGRGGAEGRTSEILNEAKLELDAASEIVDAFRTLARSEGPHFAPVSREEIMTCLGQECSARGLSLVSDDVEGGRFRTDPVLLARCLRNLVDNALETSPAEGVSVSVEGSNPLRIRVSDSGPGLPDPPELVFRPFFSTGRERGHMGIGLTVSRRIILAMGGGLTAENTGRGASFTITLPLEESC
jgi:signal transduction histidine kinase